MLIRLVLTRILLRFLFRVHNRVQSLTPTYTPRNSGGKIIQSLRGFLTMVKPPVESPVPAMENGHPDKTNTGGIGLSPGEVNKHA